VRESSIEEAAQLIRQGGLVIYPTETVYGLGADALNPEAIGAIFEVKGRSPEKPLSLGVPSVDQALEFTVPTDREKRFMRTFLPGPVTVVVPKRRLVPDKLTGGREKVGVRVPDHDGARTLFKTAGHPVTATSANQSGQPSARRCADIDSTVRQQATVIDTGETPGIESTVVDVGEDRILRDGALGEAIREWLDTERLGS
jgi:L-threonylcarbamoyladenylate synthase